MSKVDINDICLLITGCISPVQSQKNLFLKNIEKREQQYIESIKYYICDTNIKNIVFCENSDYSSKFLEYMYNLSNKCNKNFEWISFQGDHLKVQEKGKGYGEGEIIKYALNNSFLLENTKYFFKVTGRLRVLNINKICKKISSSPSFNYDVFRTNAFDTRFYFIEKNFYKKQLQDLYLVVTEEEPQIVALEDIFYKMLNGSNVSCLPYYPEFSGISGGTGIDYSNTSKKSLCFYNILCFLKLFNTVYPFYIKVKRKVIRKV